MEIIPNWHPVAVHFSVALLITATALLAFALIKGQTEASNRLVSAGRLILWLGLGAIIATVALGLQAYYSVDHDSPSHAAMTNHKNWAFGVLAAFILSGFLMLRERTKALSAVTVAALVLSSGVLLSTAYRGGKLVYKYGLGVQSLPQVSGEGHDHEHAEGEGHGDSPVAVKEHNHDEGVSDGHGENKENGHAHPNAVLIDPSLVADAFNKALNAGDAEAVGKILAEDVVILESGHAQKSRAEYMNGHMKSDMAFLPHITTTLLDRQTSQAGDLAWIISHVSMKGEYKDKTIDIISREMLVMKHNGHDWQITMVHWSDN